MSPSRVGRYEIFDQIGAGGMGAVHLGVVHGALGFRRVVAIKRLHEPYATSAECVAMLLDEARLASRIRHPNVVGVIDVVAERDRVLLVMEYVAGESLSRLIHQGPRDEQARAPVPPSIATAIFVDVLRGLHAAHEARDERGQPLDLVHRDVNPQNVLVGVAGEAYLADFGIAKATGRMQETRGSDLKGKLSYMSPEQLSGLPLDRTTDLYGAAVALWEALTGTRLFETDDHPALVRRILAGEIAAPSSVEPSVPRALDALVLRALSPDRRDRPATAAEFGAALEAAQRPALREELAAWLSARAGPRLEARAALVRAIEQADPPAPAGASEAELREAAPVTVGPRTELPDPSQRARKRALVVLLAVAGAAVAASAVVLLAAGEPAPTAVPAVVATSRAPTLAEAPAPFATSTPPVPTAEPTPSAATSTAPPRPTARRPAASARPPPSPRPDCAVPWITEPDGRKRYKVECL
jgi:serine/threonine-protein kinase